MPGRLNAVYNGGVAASLNLPFQAKFAVGKADDPFEREADTVADRVVGGQAPPPITSIPSGGLTTVAQKEEPAENEEEDRQPALMQRESVEGGEPSDDEEDALQAKATESETEEEPEDAEPQPRLLQRDETSEPEQTEEPEPQARLIQRVANGPGEAGEEESDEPELQTRRLQLQPNEEAEHEDTDTESGDIQTAVETTEEDPDEMQPMRIQRMCAECEQEQEAPVQTQSVIQRKVEFPSVPEATEGEEKKSAEKDQPPEKGGQTTEEGGAEEAAEKGQSEGAGGEDKVQEPAIEPYEPVEKTQPVQTKPSATNSRRKSPNSDLQERLSGGSGGAPMAPPVRRDMEQRFGRDLSGVRIHTDAGAAQMNKELGARAFTHQGNIYFAPGQYQPDSQSGKHLLAHELTHTVQQGAVGNTVQRHTAPEQDVSIPSRPERPDDGEEVEGRMDEKIDEETEEKDPEDLSEEERREAENPDRDEVRRESSELENSGQTSPSVDRGARAEEQTRSQKEEIDQQVNEQSQEAGEEEGEGEEEQAEMSEAEAAAQRARVAEERAQSIPIPAEPEPFRQPNIETPKDSAGEPVPRQSQMDTQVRGLGYIGEMLREKGYEMKRAAAEKEMGAYTNEAVLEKQREDLANAREGTAKMQEHNDGRAEIATKSREAHTESVERQQFVAEKAPDLASKADEGGEDSGALAREAGSKADRAESEVPDDPDARRDAEEQSGDMQNTAEGAESMDRAVTQTGQRARQYQRDAEQASEQNQQSETQINETDNLIEQTDSRLEEMRAANDSSAEQIENISHGPETIRRHARRTARSGDELIAATIVMERELNALQDEYLDSMSALESREEAEERLREEQERAAEQPEMSPEMQELVELSELEEEEQEQRIGEMDQPHRNRLIAALDEMMQMAPESGTDETEGRRYEVNTGGSQALGEAQSAVSEAVIGQEASRAIGLSQPAADPRAEQIQEIDDRRARRVGGVVNVADRNMTFLSQEQQRMLAERLVAQSITDDIANINVLQMGRQMLLGMVNPVMALQGVVGGFDKMLTGLSNIGNWEAWRRDPLGNLLQIAGDISTGLATVFSSVLGLATIITALMVVLTIASWGTLSWMTMPVIGWMGTVMTYAGWGAIIAGSLSVYFNYLSYIKNLHEAATADTATELFGNTEQMRQNANDGFTGAMAVVEGVGAVKMGPRLSGGEFFQRVPRSPGAWARQTGGRISDTASGIARLPGRISRGAGALLRGGRRGMSRLKQRLQSAIRRRRSARPDTQSPAARRQHQRDLDTARESSIRDMDEPQFRAELDEVGRSQPRRVPESSPHHREYDIEVEANGHTYRRRRDGRGWCRFSAKECGISDEAVPDEVRERANDIDTEPPETTRDTRSGRQQAIDNGFPEEPPPGYHWYTGPDGMPRVSRNPGYSGPLREFDPDVPARQPDGSPTPLEDRFPVVRGTRGLSRRAEYVGSTPGKRSRTGREVIERMRRNDRVRGSKPNEEVLVEGPPRPWEERWYPIDEMDMGHHPKDAVSYWNEEGKFHGPRSDEVREWMLDPDNYELQHRSKNRSEGARSSETYDPPPE